jgi:hypothetical protein
MVWLYEKTPIEQLPDDCVGFVYLITNTVTGRKYIGKKLAKFSKTSYRGVKLKNGNKKRKKIGSDNFTREILFYCKSKAECSYIEAREQFNHRVLESDDYYNGQIVCRIHGSHIKNKI